MINSTLYTTYIRSVKNFTFAACIAVCDFLDSYMLFSNRIYKHEVSQ